MAHLKQVRLPHFRLKCIIINFVSSHERERTLRLVVKTRFIIVVHPEIGARSRHRNCIYLNLQFLTMFYIYRLRAPRS